MSQWYFLKNAEKFVITGEEDVRWGINYVHGPNMVSKHDDVNLYSMGLYFG